MSRSWETRCSSRVRAPVGGGGLGQCAPSARVAVADYYYVGGYYGAAASLGDQERAALLQREVSKVETLPMDMELGTRLYLD